MQISAKRKLVVGATAAAVLAGSGGAYAAAQSSSTPSPTKIRPAVKIDLSAEQKAFLDDVAKRLNVTRDQLDAAVKGAAEARIDAAVAAGKLTKEQGEAAKQRLSAGAPFFGAGPILAGGHRGGLHRGGPIGFGIDAAAKYLGLTEAQLREQIRDGKSLADVAKAQNKSVDGLKAALKTALTAKLDQAVKNNRLTEAQKTKILADVDARLDEVVNNTRPAGPPRDFKRRWR